MSTQRNLGSDDPFSSGNKKYVPNEHSVCCKDDFYYDENGYERCKTCRKKCQVREMEEDEYADRQEKEMYEDHFDDNEFFHS